ncbi:hypothetical protein C8Q75DRAFT_809019 [Abortiporus biennis]|nr:hypothetical protein C8Q75DRAFT_809019 [Abortiporus biennis]
MPDWLCDNGPELPLTNEDVRRLYSEPTSPSILEFESPTLKPMDGGAVDGGQSSSSPSSIQFPHSYHSTLRQQPRQRQPLPSPELQSLWDDDDEFEEEVEEAEESFEDDDGDDEFDGEEEGEGEEDGDDRRQVDEERNRSVVSPILPIQHLHKPGSTTPPLIDDLQPSHSRSTSSMSRSRTPLKSEFESQLFESESDNDSEVTLHDVPIASTCKHPISLIRLCTYNYLEPRLVVCLDSMDEKLIREPLTVFADVCYNSCVRRDPLNGDRGILRQNSDLDRVSEEEVDEEEEESEEEDSEPELASPIRGPITQAKVWTHESPVLESRFGTISALELSPGFRISSEDTKRRPFSPEPSTPIPPQVAYLFLRSPPPAESQQDSIGCFPTRPQPPSEPELGRVKNLMRSISLSWRERIHSASS